MDIKTQMNRARYLIDVLTARTLCTDGRQADFACRDGGRADDRVPVYIALKCLSFFQKAGFQHEIATLHTAVNFMTVRAFADANTFHFRAFLEHDG